MLKKNVPVAELEFGMYVSELDRPGTDTPFMFQGFVLQTEAQLETLRQFCKSVFVDVAKSEAKSERRLKPFVARYPVQVPVEREAERAKGVQSGTQGTIREVLGAVRAKRTLDAKSIDQAVSSMTESVLRNRFSRSCARKATTPNPTRSIPRST